MDPMLRHLKRQLLRNGDHWKIAESLKACNSDAAASIATARDWPLVLAATGSLEREALNAIEQKHDTAGRFDCISPSQKTVALNNSLFKMLSRQGARMYELLARHEGFPYIMWLLLVDPEKAMAIIRRTCATERGAYANAFIAHYGLENLTSPHALAELTLIMQVVQLSTVMLENGNAGLKHSLDIMSCHVRLPTLGRLSADALLSKFRYKHRNLNKPPGMRRLVEGTYKRMTAKRRKLEAKRKRAGAPQRRKGSPVAEVCGDLMYPGSVAATAVQTSKSFRAGTGDCARRKKTHCGLQR